MPDEAGPPPAKTGDKPLTRRGCLLGLLGWLLIITVPFCLILFAIRGDLTWQRGDLTQDRLWLITQSAETGQDSAGVAYSATRLAANPAAPQGALCARTTVYFLLWRGQSETVQYCECYQPRPGSQTGFDSLGVCP